MTVLNIDALIENADWPKRTNDVLAAKSLKAALPDGPHLYLAPWRPDLHPKWPKGTPGKTRTGHPLAGKFMQTVDVSDLAKRTLTGWADLTFLTRGSHAIERVQARGTPDGGAEFKVTAHDGIHRVVVAPHTHFEQVMGAFDHIDRGERAPEAPAIATSPGPPPVPAEGERVVRLSDVPDLKIVRIDGKSYRKMPTSRSDGRIRLVPVEGGNDLHYKGTKMVIVAAPVPPPPPPVVHEDLGKLEIGDKFLLDGEVWTVRSRPEQRADRRVRFTTVRDGRTVTRHARASLRVQLHDGPAPPPPPPPVPPGPEWTGAFKPKSIKDIEPGTKVTLLGGETVTVKRGTDPGLRPEPGQALATWGVYTDAEGHDRTLPHDQPVFPPTDPDFQMQNRKYLGAIPAGYVVELADGHHYRITGPATRGDSETNGLQDWLIPLANVETGERVERDAKVLVHVGPQIRFREGPQRLDTLPDGNTVEVYYQGEKFRIYKHRDNGETDLIRVDPSEETRRIEGTHRPVDSSVLVWTKQPEIGQMGQIGSLPEGAVIRLFGQGADGRGMAYEVVAFRQRPGTTEPEVRMRNLTDPNLAPEWWPANTVGERIAPPPPPATDETFGGKLADRFNVGDHAWYDGFEWVVKSKSKRGVTLASPDAGGPTKTHFVGRATPLADSAEAAADPSTTAGKRLTVDQLVAEAKRIADAGGLNSEEQFRALGSLVRRAVLASEETSEDVTKYRDAQRRASAAYANIKRLQQLGRYGYSYEQSTDPTVYRSRKFATAELAQEFKQALQDHSRATQETDRWRPSALAVLDRQRGLARAITMEVLRKIRPMGGTLRYRNEGATATVMDRVNFADEVFPSDWIDKSNGAGVVGVKSHRSIRAFHTGGFGDSQINVKNDEPDSIILHEIGHRWEYQIEGLSKLTRAFRILRAPGEVNRSLVGVGGASNREIGVRDEFFAAYMGKDYGFGDATEIFTMGLEDVFFRSRRSKHTDVPDEIVPGGNYDLLVDDPDYADFMLGLLAGLPPAGTNPPTVHVPHVRAEPISARRTQLGRLRVGKQIKLSPAEQGYWQVRGRQPDGTILLRKFVDGAWQERNVSPSILVYTRPSR